MRPQCDTGLNPPRPRGDQPNFRQDPFHVHPPAPPTRGSAGSYKSRLRHRFESAPPTRGSADLARLTDFLPFSLLVAVGFRRLLGAGGLCGQPTRPCCKSTATTPPTQTTRLGDIHAWTYPRRMFGVQLMQRRARRSTTRTSAAANHRPVSEGLESGTSVVRFMFAMFHASTASDL